MGGSIIRTLPKLLVRGTRKSLAQVADELKFKEVDPRIIFSKLNGSRYNRAFSVNFSEATGRNVIPVALHESQRHCATLRDVLLFVYDLILHTDKQKFDKLKVNILALGTQVTEGTLAFVPVVKIYKGECAAIELLFVGSGLQSKRSVLMLRINPASIAA